MIDQNSGVFPESANELKNVLNRFEFKLSSSSLFVNSFSRLWSNRLDEDQFADLLLEIPSTMHKLMKNMLEFVFATSPLLILSTSGWLRCIQGAYLLRVRIVSSAFVLSLPAIIDVFPSFSLLLVTIVLKSSFRRKIKFWKLLLAFVEASLEKMS